MFSLKFGEEAGVVFRKAWSIRFAVAASILSGLEVGMQFFAPERRNGYFAIAAAVVSGAGVVARLLSQRSFPAKDVN